VSLSSPTATRPLEMSTGAATDRAGDLLQALGAVPDPRPGGGRRHPLAFVLGVLVMSFTCSGFGSFTGAAQWAEAASARLLLALGAAPDPLTGAVRAPSEATIRRIATRVDNEAFEAVVAAWTAGLVTAPAREGEQRLAGGRGRRQGLARCPRRAQPRPAPAVHCHPPHPRSCSRSVRSPARPTRSP